MTHPSLPKLMVDGPRGRSLSLSALRPAAALASLPNHAYSGPYEDLELKR